MRWQSVYWTIGALVASMIAGLIAVAAAAAPIVQSTLGYPAGEEIYAVLASICHQYPTRSFWLLERPMAICARCFSMYISFCIVIIMSITSQRVFVHLSQIPTVVILALMTPLVLDGAMQGLAFYESVNLARLTTGILFGVGIGALFLRTGQLGKADA